MGTSVWNFNEITMTDSDNVCVMLHKIDDLRIDPCPVPEPDEHEVLLKMDSVGICGSDVHYWKSGHIGEFVVKEPLILGHEGAGIVVKCGSKVTHLQPGDRVAVEPQTTCFRCDKCKTGRYNLCPDVTFCATPPHDGHLRPTTPTRPVSASSYLITCHWKRVPFVSLPLWVSMLADVARSSLERLCWCVGPGPLVSST